MKVEKNTPTRERDFLQSRAVDIGRIHFYIAGLFAGYIFLSDAWDLITPELIYRRFMMTAALLVFTTLFFAASRIRNATAQYYRLIIYGIILIDIFFATFAIYSQRGMASRGALLYALPVVISAVLIRFRTLTVTTAACVTAYFLAALAYYDSHPNEGYLAELYIEVGFYSAILFVLAAILWLIVRPRKS